jgi:CHAD domain-containing protein
MLAKEPGARLGDDIEELHDMRVATRRLRAGLSLFAEALPATAQSLREELGWLGRVLGAVRDLDVQVEQLDAWLAEVPETDRDALEALRALLRHQRAQARTAMLEALDSRRYQLLLDRLRRMLVRRRPPRTDAAATLALAVAPELIERHFRRLRKAARRIARDSSASDYHRVRIRAKRLRYALEFLADLYPEGTRPLLRRLVALQDILGQHQDADVTITRLRTLADEHGADLGPTTIFSMGEIAGRYREEMTALQDRFPPAYERITGKPWKQLRALLEQHRPANCPPAATRRDEHASIGGESTV